MKYFIFPLLYLLIFIGCGSLKQDNPVYSEMRVEKREAFLAFESDDIKNWRTFIEKLQNAQDDNDPSPIKRIWESLSDQSRVAKMIFEEKGSKESEQNVISGDDKDFIIVDINKMLEQRDFYKMEYFANSPIPSTVLELLNTRVDKIPKPELRTLTLYKSA